MFKRTVNRILNNKYSVNKLVPKYRRYTTIKGLTFKIKKEEASNILSEKGSIFEQTQSFSGNSLVIYDKDPMEQYYIPFHSLDISDLSCDFFGEYGIDRIEYYTYWQYDPNLKISVMKTGTRTVTDWYRCQGTTAETDYPLGTKETQIYAGFKYPRKYIEETLTMEDIKDITNISINENEKIETFEMNMSYGLEKMINSLRSLELSRTKKFICRKFRADRSRIHNLDLHLDKSNIKLYSYYIPCYVYTYIINENKYYKFVNGYLGSYNGQSIYSFWKVFLATFPLGFIFPVLPITQTFLISSHIVLRFLFFGISTGLPSGLLAKFYPLYRYNKQSNQQSEELSYNNTTLETDDDRARKQDSSQKQKTFPIHHCHILGLDPSKPLTKELIKNAYYKKIKLYHSDCYRGDPEFAKHMSQQLNSAYQELSSCF